MDAWSKLLVNDSVKPAKAVLIAFWHAHCEQGAFSDLEDAMAGLKQSCKWQALANLRDAARQICLHTTRPLPACLEPLEGWAPDTRALRVAQAWEQHFPRVRFAKLLLDMAGPHGVEKLQAAWQRGEVLLRGAPDAAALGAMRQATTFLLDERMPSVIAPTDAAAPLLDALVARLPLAAPQLRAACQGAVQMPSDQRQAWIDHLGAFDATEETWFWKLERLIVRAATAQKAGDKTFGDLGTALGIVPRDGMPIELCKLETGELLTYPKFDTRGRLQGSAGKSVAGVPPRRADAIAQQLVAYVGAHPKASLEDIRAQATRLTTCALLGVPVNDPVMTADGEVYDRGVITAWLARHDTTPLANARLPNKQVVPLLALASLVDGTAPAPGAAFALALGKQVEDLNGRARKLAGEAGGISSKDPTEMAALRSLRAIDTLHKGWQAAINALPAAARARVRVISSQQAAIALSVDAISPAVLRVMGLSGQDRTLFLDFASPAAPPRFYVRQGDQVLGGGQATSGGTRWWSVPPKGQSLLLSGSDVTRRAAYALTQAIAQELPKLHGWASDGRQALAAIDAAAQRRLEQLCDACLVCAKDHGARLSRAVPCSAAGCLGEADKVALQLLQDDLHTDKASVWLLIAMANAASRDVRMVSRLGAPERDASQLQTLLDRVPPVEVMAASTHLQADLAAIDARLPRLLAWVMSTYRGAVSSVSEAERIVTARNAILQFRVHSTSPEREAAYARAAAAGATEIVYHGTSVGRMHNILREGLRSLSNDLTLRAHGAVYGSGIYTSTDPAAAADYMGGSPIHVRPRSSDDMMFGYGDNYACMLVCEARQDVSAPHRPTPSGFRVISDESRVALRYILVGGFKTEVQRSAV